MTDTIKAKNGYRVKKVKNIITGETAYRIDDGEQPLFVAQKKSREEYESNKSENEAFMVCEVFTTVKGNQFIYWRDNELDEDYITKVPKEEQK